MYEENEIIENDAQPDELPSMDEDPLEPEVERTSGPSVIVAIIFLLWIIGTYGAFYYFLLQHRFESFAMGG